MKQYPSQEKLKELFSYDQEGFLVWRKTLSRRAVSGSIAGNRGFNSELRYVYDIGVGGSLYKGVRLVWIWHYGFNPSGKIYRKNGLNSDSRIENLTLENTAARTFKPSDMGGSRYIGVYKRGDSWAAEFKGKRLGHFRSESAAARAYDIAAEMEYGRSGFVSNLGDCDLDIEKYRTTTFGNRRISKRDRGIQSKYIGVSRHYTKRKGLRFSVKFRCKHIGIFDTEEQAARAYNIAAYDAYGDAAVLNDIPDQLGKGDLF